MSRRSRRRWVALTLSLVPGWGHVYWGREVLGLALFTAAATFGFAWLNGRFIYRGDGREFLVWTAGVLGAAVFAGTWADLFLRTSPSRCRREEEAWDHLLRQGMIAYLRSDFRQAAVLFIECLRIDPQDVEALFRLGMTCARSGDRREARRWFRRARRHDVEGKWSWELGRELGRLEQDEKADVVRNDPSEGNTLVSDSTQAPEAPGAHQAPRRGRPRVAADAGEGQRPPPEEGSKPGVTRF